MSEEIMLENKQVLIGESEYRLSIIKTLKESYEAHLSDVNSQFSVERTFNSLLEIENKLMSWMKGMNSYNNPEVRVFEELRRWDGVIEV